MRRKFATCKRKALALVFSLQPSRTARQVSLLLAAAVAAASLTAKPAFPQEIAACDQFFWPVKREQALFASKDLKHAASGATLEFSPDHGAGAALELQPNDAVPFVVAPGRPPKTENSFGGVIVITNIPKAQAYQVTASGEGWIDVIQDGKAIASTGHSGRRDCPDVHKSVRFDLQPGAATIQVSGSPAKSINLAIMPAE